VDCTQFVKQKLNNNVLQPIKNGVEKVMDFVANTLSSLGSAIMSVEGKLEGEGGYIQEMWVLFL
jgi:hypothetical protein